MLRRLSTITMLVGLFLSAVPGAASQAPEPHGAAASFAGHVFDRATGSPIPGAQITVGNGGWPPVFTIYPATTDRAGYYAIPDLPAANDYTVLASAPSYASQDVTMRTPPAVVDFRLAPPSTGFLVSTINQGLREYAFNGSFSYRVDGEVTPNALLFPSIDAQTDAITALLAEIGAGTGAPRSDAELWQKAWQTRTWLMGHIVSFQDPRAADAYSYLYANDWPTIERIAQTYRTYGFLPWGACMAQSQLLVTLWYRAGIPKENLAIANIRTLLRYTNHRAPLLYVSHRWLYIENSASTMPDWEHFSSHPITGDPAPWDYLHPVAVDVIPGARLTEVPEVTRRPVNSAQIFVASPPNGTVTLAATVPVKGFVGEGVAGPVRVNGQSAPVRGGVFEAVVPLVDGDNRIEAEVTVAGTVYRDSLSVKKVTVANCPLPAPPDLLAPADGTGTADTRPTLSWRSVAGAAGYQVQLDDDPSFSGPQADVVSTATQYRPAQALRPDVYYWRVRAYRLGESCLLWGPWSATRAVMPGATRHRYLPSILRGP